MPNKIDLNKIGYVQPWLFIVPNLVFKRNISFTLKKFTVLEILYLSF